MGMEVYYLGCVLGLAGKITSSYCSEPRGNTAARLIVLVILLGFRIGFVVSNFLQLLVICLVVCGVFQGNLITKYKAAIAKSLESEIKTFCNTVSSGLEKTTGIQICEEMMMQL